MTPPLAASQRVTEVYTQARCRLEDPDVGPEEAPVLVVFLSELAAERLPGTREEDPLRMYLEAAEGHLEAYMRDCEIVMQVWGSWGGLIFVGKNIMCTSGYWLLGTFWERGVLLFHPHVTPTICF